MFFGLTNHYKNYYVQHHAKSKLCNSWAIYCNYTIITLYKKYIHLNKNNFIWLFYVNMIKWLFKVDNWSSRHKFVRLLEEEIKLLIKSDFAGLKKLLLTSLLMLSLYICILKTFVFWRLWHMYKITENYMFLKSKHETLFLHTVFHHKTLYLLVFLHRNNFTQCLISAYTFIFLFFLWHYFFFSDSAKSQPTSQIF